eukprot:896939-Rhodomonas_salina.2
MFGNDPWNPDVDRMARLTVFWDSFASLTSVLTQSEPDISVLTGRAVLSAISAHSASGRDVGLGA